MSRKLILSFTSLFVVGFASAWITNQYLGQKPHHEKKKQNFSFIRVEKHLTPIVMTIEGPEVFPEDENEAVLLKGQLRTPYPDFSQLQYEWVLPEEVEVLKGQVSGDIQSPAINQVYEVELLVKGFNSLQRKDMTLIVSTLDKAGVKIGNSALITSRPEDSLEHLAPVVMAEAQELKASQMNERMPASGNEQ
jgi:hypothetical protein